MNSKNRVIYGFGDSVVIDGDFYEVDEYVKDTQKYVVHRSIPGIDSSLEEQQSRMRVSTIQTRED